MNCPRCTSAVLDERERQKLTVDVCPSCRGVWLDRGELEKLIAFAARDLDEVSHGRDDDRAPGSRDYDYVHGRHLKKKRRWIDSLAEIFD